MTSQRPSSSTIGVTKILSHGFPIYRIARRSIFYIRRSDFRYLSHLIFYPQNPVRNPISVSQLSSFLDLHSCGTVDLVRSRHCARSRQHHRTDRRSGKDHTLTLQRRHERFQTRLSFLARLVTARGPHGDPNPDHGQTRSNNLSNPWALLDTAAAYLKDSRSYSRLCTLRLCIPYKTRAS